jgi:hypothetical protein
MANVEVHLELLVMGQIACESVRKTRNKFELLRLDLRFFWEREKNPGLKASLFLLALCGG